MSVLCITTQNTRFILHEDQKTGYLACKSAVLTEMLIFKTGMPIKKEATVCDLYINYYNRGLLIGSFQKTVKRGAAGFIPFEYAGILQYMFKHSSHFLPQNFFRVLF